MTEPKKARKRAPARDSDSGKFESASPLSDPELMELALRIVRAVNDLEEPLAVMALHAQDEVSAKGFAFVGASLAVLRDSMLQQLAADPESLREAKKKRIDAKRLGNIPLAEQQRVMALANEWMALPSAAVRALNANANPASLADDGTVH
jgi:hypothetical protein